MNCLETVIFAILEVALRSLRNAYSFVGNSRQIGSTLVVLGKLTTSRARPCLAVALSIVLALCITSIVTTVSAAPADPGHAASRISAGTFEAGNFVFPDNLTINDFLTVNATTLYVNAVQGRVGIGTASPNYLLEVADGTEDAVNLSGVLYVNDTSGNVGIGTTTPDVELDIEGTGGTMLQMIGTTSPALSIVDVGGPTTYLSSTGTYGVVGTSSAHPFHLYTSGSSQMTILSDGKVGIGTDTPSTNLNVKGTLSTALTGTLNTSDVSNVANTSDDLTSEISVGDAIKIVNASDSSDSEVFTVNAVTSANLTLDSTPGKNWTDALGYKDSGLFRVDDGDGTGKFIVDKSGQVGIGTDNPSVKLDVKSGAISTDVLRVLSSDGGSIFEISEDSGTGGFVGIKDASAVRQVLLHTSGDSYLNGGSVGIGTISPNLRSDTLALTLSTGATAGQSAIDLQGNRTNDNPVGRINAYNSANLIGAIEFRRDTADDKGAIGFWTDNGTFAERVRIDNDGNVGINTTSPGSLLHVSGGNILVNDTYGLAFVDTNTRIYRSSNDIILLSGDDILLDPADDLVTRANQITFETTGSDEKMRIDTTTGQVGIGTISPGNELEVNGTINASAIQVGTMDVCQSDGTNCPSGMANSSAWNRSGTDVFLANSGDSVGIGTDSPSYLLEVGDGTENAVNLSGVLYVNDTSGNVGIGTSSPGYLLSFPVAVGQKIELYNNAPGNDNEFGLGVESSELRISAGQSSKIAFRTDGYNGTEIMVIASDGKVGIGTASPEDQLDVNSSGDSIIDIRGGASNDEIIRFAEQTTTKAWAGWDSSLALFKINANAGFSAVNHFVIDTSGNVGVNTTSPDSLVGAGPTVHIAGTNPSFDLERITSGTEAKASLRIADTEDLVFRVQDGAASAIDAMAILSDSGDVGIGMTSPTQKLHVNGTIKSDSSGVGTIQWGAAHHIMASNFSGGLNRIGLQSWDGSDYFDGIIVYGTEHEVLLAQDEGVVGIGTAGPNYKLDVNGTSNFEDTMTFNSVGGPSGVISFGAGDFIVRASSGKNLTLGADASTDMTILTSGNVGIGTTDPVNKLDVRPFTSSGSDTIGTGGISLGSDNPYWTFRISATPLADLTFDRLYSTVYYEAMRIQRSTGNVGIGTTSPNATLHLNASHDETNPIFRIERGGGQAWGIHENNNYFNIRDITGTDDRFTIDTSGNVGVDDTSPDAKLEVFASSGPQLMLTHTDNTDYANFTVDSDGNLTISSSSGNVIIQLG